MKELIAGKNDAGRRIDRFLSHAFPLLPLSLIQKAIRTRHIKLNGGRCTGKDLLTEGDRVTLYLTDEQLTKRRFDNIEIHELPDPDILYEDKNILLADKKPGLVVHEDEKGSPDTLIARIQSYLLRKGEWDPSGENTFAPALCNRIDRNTGGIVIAAKNAETLRILDEKIRNREIEKRYLCAVIGCLEPSAGTLRGYLYKDESEKRVYMRSSQADGAKTAVTQYRTLETAGDLSLVECLLITGRTHQIRAQMAAAGHPLAGDGKYGVNRFNRTLDIKYQALYAYRLRFTFNSPAGILNYLTGREFTVPDVAFVSRLGFSWTR